MKKVLSILACLALVLSCCIMGIGTVATAEEASPEADFLVFDGVLEEYIGPGGDVVIPASLGVVEVASYAFANNLDIESIVFPEGVEIIAYRACYQSENLSAVTLPYSLYEIGGTAFSHCGITEVMIPGNCEIIPFGAFGHCPISDLKLSYGVREIHTSAFSSGMCKTVIFPETVELICGFSFVFPRDTGKIEFIICNPDCEIGPTVQGIKENNEHSWDGICSLSYSAINRTQGITYIIPEGSSMRSVIENEMRAHLDGTKGSSTDVSGNKLTVREKPLSYFENLEENQEGYGVQPPKNDGTAVDPNTPGDGGNGGNGNGNGGNGNGNANGNNGNGSNNNGGNNNGSSSGQQIVIEGGDDGNVWLILGIVGGVVLLIIIGVVVFLVIYMKKPKAAAQQVVYMIGPDGKPVPVMMSDSVSSQDSEAAVEETVEEAPVEDAE